MFAVIFEVNPRPEAWNDYLSHAAALRPEQQDVGTLRQPSIAGRQRHHLSFRDHWDGLEVERGECLAGW